jgi:hypothetical protein
MRHLLLVLLGPNFAGFVRTWFCQMNTKVGHQGFLKLLFKLLELI